MQPMGQLSLLQFKKKLLQFSLNPFQLDSKLSYVVRAQLHHPGVPPALAGLPTTTPGAFTTFQLLSITPKQEHTQKRPWTYSKKIMQSSHLCSGWLYWEAPSPSSHIRKLWKTWKLFQSLISKKSGPCAPRAERSSGKSEVNLNLLLHSSLQQKLEGMAMATWTAPITGVHFYPLQRPGNSELLLLFHIQRVVKWENHNQKTLQFLPVFTLKIREMSEKSKLYKDQCSLPCFTSFLKVDKCLRVERIGMSFGTAEKENKPDFTGSPGVTQNRIKCTYLSSNFSHHLQIKKNP